MTYYTESGIIVVSLHFVRQVIFEGDIFMEVEITREQKDALAKKIGLCVDFLKTEVQPHLIPSDKLKIEMSEILDLYITRSELYVVRNRTVNFLTDINLKSNFYLEKLDRKKSKQFICDACPELAVDFLKHWPVAKNRLIDEVVAKNKKISELNDFVDNFEI